MVGVEEMAAFISAIGRDRKSLDAAGGVSHLLWQAGVEHVQVVEVSVKSESPTAAAGPRLIADDQPVITLSDWISPQERERVIEILRAGPEEGGKLLENLSATPGTDGAADSQVEGVYQTLRHLDRLILNEPVEDQAELAALLAEASTRLPDPIRTSLDRTLLARVGEDVTADLLVGHFSPERLAQAMLSVVAQDKIVEQVATLLVNARISREKAGAVLSILDERLRPAGEKPQWLARAVWPLLQASRPHPDVGLVWDGDLAEQQLTVGDAAIAARRAEVQTDDPGITREVVRTLVDVLLAEDDRRELADTANLLETHLAWILEHDDFTLLAQVFRGLRALAVSPTESQREVAARIRQAASPDRIAARFLTLLWDHRGTAQEQEIYLCFDLAAEMLIGPLVRTLEQEPQAGKRLMICDVLVAIGRPHLDEIARSLTDQHGELVGNIASVLGRLAVPEAVPHLARVRRHPEYRVRCEVCDALSRIGTTEAQVLLAYYLDDSDTRIRVRALGALNAVGVEHATSRLTQVLRARDWLNRRFEIRQAALSAAERFGDHRLLPAAQALARQWVCFGARGREIRRLAGVAETAIRARHAATAAMPAARGQVGAP
jgi:hypothetical protein